MTLRMSALCALLTGALLVCAPRAGWAQQATPAQVATALSNAAQRLLAPPEMREALVRHLFGRVLVPEKTKLIAQSLAPTLVDPRLAELMGKYVLESRVRLSSPDERAALMVEFALFELPNGGAWRLSAQDHQQLLAARVALTRTLSAGGCVSMVSGRMYPRDANLALLRHWDQMPQDELQRLLALYRRSATAVLEQIPAQVVAPREGEGELVWAMLLENVERALSSRPDAADVRRAASNPYTVSPSLACDVFQASVQEASAMPAPFGPWAQLMLVGRPPANPTEGAR